MAETFNNATVKLTTTSATTIYQAPTANAADRAIALSCLVGNVATVITVGLTLTLTDSADAVLSTLLYEVGIPANASLEAIANKVVLKQGQKLRATATHANGLEITLSVLEVTA